MYSIIMPIFVVVVLSVVDV